LLVHTYYLIKPIIKPLHPSVKPLMPYKLLRFYGMSAIMNNSLPKPIPYYTEP